MIFSQRNLGIGLVFTTLACAGAYDLGDIALSWAMGFLAFCAVFTLMLNYLNHPSV